MCHTTSHRGSADTARSRRDFEAFARQTGNALVHQTEEGREWAFWLKRR